MRFGAILSVLSLGLVAFAAPAAYVQGSALAYRAPAEIAVRGIISPVEAYHKRAEGAVAVSSPGPVNQLVKIHER
ncbi:hypothetical protein BOTBODRAFT_180182 [Botryobasidium botryosum FD-172 SS1]|uniref:Uncharacterized protein n=1 Tax=Botryobasidium botryosum (strain FD-172 SS1) TaxID=930990 RepID=A0A067LXT7_BOTB1|nr:hypothetical protein BOTBODRAFT_180182 [Botryobasidium botryosum FD-172 SS1]